LFVAPIGTNLEQAAGYLRQGELVAIPTETVYGLAANALNADAVAKIFLAKGRPTFDPLIVHIPDAGKIEQYSDRTPSMAYDLAEKFWPGPLTILLHKKSIIPDLVTAGLEQVGLRCPDHPLTRALLERVDFPLAAPSANPFGYISPTTSVHVQRQLGNAIKYILDGGPCRIGIESTVVGFQNDQPVVYRLGGLAIEKLKAVTGKVKLELNQSSNPAAPGQLKSHYAPKKKLLFGNPAELLPRLNELKTGLLSFQHDYGLSNQIILSKSGSTQEAAKNLFSALRELDESDCDVIIAEPVPTEGLGSAINDRLLRASA
jgi:L-threonylcarbamoyladenylate synthase